MVSVVRQQSSSRVSDIAFCGLAIALMAVGAWVTVPLGPVPFTLQTFVIMLVILTLTPKQSVIAVVGYVLLGAIGVPVLAGMSGGIGDILGPTGGFIWGFIVGALAAAICTIGLRKTALADSGVKGHLTIAIVAVVVFNVFMYACGVAQLSAVAGCSLAESAVIAVVPFIVTDTAKMVAAIAIAEAVNVALGRTE